VVAPMAGVGTTRELAPRLDARVVGLPARRKRARLGIEPCQARKRTGRAGPAHPAAGPAFDPLRPGAARPPGCVTADGVRLAESGSG
jgi:hypothetical protein